MYIGKPYLFVEFIIGWAISSANLFRCIKWKWMCARSFSCAKLYFFQVVITSTLIGALLLLREALFYSRSFEWSYFSFAKLYFIREALNGAISSKRTNERSECSERSERMNEVNVVSGANDYLVFIL